MNEELSRLIALFPAEKGASPDWTAIRNTAFTALFERMEQTPQQPEWHGEGDVWTHTKMVCETLLKRDGYWLLTRRRQSELFLAALLHDIGKIRCTRQENGRWVSPHHAQTGACMARELFIERYAVGGTEESVNFRETVCQLIRYHPLPVVALERDEPERLLRRVAADGELAADFTLNMLCLLSRADALGRIAADVDRLEEAVCMCAELADETGCLYGPAAFASDCTRHAYLIGRNVMPEQPLYDDSWGEVTMLCGLPGTGKDTWIAAHCAELPMVSLDDMRRFMRVLPTEPQGGVVQACKERSREYLRKRQPFVLNATNVTADIRGNWIQLFEQYHARVRLIYLETGWAEELRRNADRAYFVPENVIGRMLAKLTPPQRFEAQLVEWRCV